MEIIGRKRKVEGNRRKGKVRKEKMKGNVIEDCSYQITLYQPIYAFHH